MLGLVLIWLLVWVSLMVILWAVSLSLQGYFYNEPEPELYWRAPAAGSALTLFLVLWCFLDYGSVEPGGTGGRYLALFDFSPLDEKTFDHLQAVISANDVRSYVRRSNAQGISEYVDAAGRPLPSHPQAIIVQEGSEEVRFEPERDPNGHFKVERGKALRYLDNRGRVMSEDIPGQVATFRWGWFLGNVMLNLMHLGLWFVCLWLLLRFEWPHALLGAGVAWLLMTLVIVPMLLDRAEKVAQQRQSPGVQAERVEPRSPEARG